MRLAWNNITSDRVRFAVTIAGIAAAVFLMVFQGSVLLGFLRAASKVIDSSDAELWISGRGVRCFEFPVEIEQRVADIAVSVAGVRSTSRICTRAVQFQKANGDQQLVSLVGAESGAGRAFPVPDQRDPEAVLVDESNARSLLVENPPSEVELNGLRARVTGTTAGFSSFLGSPYVFASYPDAARYMRLSSGGTMFVLVNLAPGEDPLAVKAALALRLPNLDVWTREEFSRRARTYWLSQTGAGGAIFIAALLGFLVGLAIVSQSMYATTMERIEEFATLKAIGASGWFIRRVILVQACLCGVAGYAVGALITGPLVEAAGSSIPWVARSGWLTSGVLAPTLAMCALASLISVRTALSVEPAKVFRA